MDPPFKKRSLFGFTSSLFRSSPMPTDNQDDTANASTTAAPAPAPTRREVNTASAPHSPMKRASESQLASRKIIGRPQPPSSKLSQSISASDIPHRPPRRMPGDNPNKPPPSFSASVASHPPSSIIPKSTSFSGVTSTPRNLFRSSALYGRPGLSTFSPRVPTNTLNQSFPPSMPGKPPRGSTPDVNGRILANTTSTELFKMRISSPPRHLTGEMLAKEVPDDPNRSGSVYADEFLAHYCPPDLDEHQRRQFFCILDLRRLKYAADEVFTKKDWKINIMNFAKEYEKSRSLIMLRYGLYEFKTVRASEALKKEWKQKHGIPLSDDESDVVPKMNGTSKRKAEEDLTPSSNTLMASVSGANKRARAPESSARNKRKADEEIDENQPAKLQKPAPTPSATKSFFESVANNAQSATPAKPVGKSLFASGAGPAPNGAVGRSLFDTAPKPAAATGNIFGHLSDESKGSGNEGADEESETSSNAEEDYSEPRDISQSDEQAASGGVLTPQFVETKKPTTNGTSSASSEAGESTQARSLFDRITRDPAGQPVRKLSPDDGNLFAAPPPNERSASPVKDQPAAAPANNTWNTGTPIKFAPTSGPASGAVAPKLESASEAPKDVASQNIFAAQAKKEEPAAPSVAPNGATPSLFTTSLAKSANTPAGAPPAFGGLGTSTTIGTSLFGSATPSFGQQKDQAEAKDSNTAPAATPSVFGPRPTTAAPEPPESNLFQSSAAFGSQSKTETAPATQPQFGSLFGKTQTTETKTEKPAPSLFSAAATKPAGNLFGTSPAPADASTEEPAAKKLAFGSNDDKSGGSLFGSGASTPVPEPTETKSIFGAASTAAAPATEAKNLFASTPAAPATQANSLFGTTAPAPAQQARPLFGGITTESKPLFGGTSTEAKPLFANASSEQKPLFGSTAGAADSKPAGLFANPLAAAPAPSMPSFNFGGSQTLAASQPTGPQQTGSIFGTGGNTSFTFSAGGSDGSTIKNPFSADGTYSAPTSFNFGSGDAAPSTSTSFTFGAGAPPSISFGGVPDNGTQPNTSFGGGPGSTFSFGGSSQPSGAPVFSQNPPAATSIFGNSLAPGGGTSTGTNTPFTFGGASSLATTPAASTPEPAATAEDGQGTKADGDDAPQEQISLIAGGPGEEDESAVHEVRAKAVKLVTGADSDDESGSSAAADKAKNKSPWKVQGVGPLRLLRHKTTGAVRMLLRAEPRGHVALNKAVLPDFTYKADTKYVKVTTASDDGKGLETWMLQVKTPAAAQALAEALEEHKKGNKK
ncbi:hypothetical protein N658DRAFT_557090 [Parathielavia hyrcaniae]|uniref:RanBD1 domain-containing protein n=1 Tax=Parathielavia hyrcaniae TaxID=113614 RepID=A0AAN6T4U9_9PEZI|nr:hypothetical protein N658DRAFT_557090 [Parathielavia hyrcaniae]